MLSRAEGTSRVPRSEAAAPVTPASAETPAEVEALERFRSEVGGRPDSFVWFFGAGCLGARLVLLWWAPPLEAAYGVGGAAVFCGYLLRRPWARDTLFVLPAAGLGLSVPYGRPTVDIALAAAVAATALIAVAHAST